MVTAFDTLQFADGLKDAGTPVAQAEATARLLGDALAAERAEQPTRADLARSDARREVLFGAVEQRFGAVDQRFERVEQRLDKVEQRMDKVEQRLDKVEQKLDKLVADVAVLNARLDAAQADTRWIKGMLTVQFVGMLGLLANATFLLQRAVG
jgi:septal ring factor EnvC (AmiA/AmiB activator)